MHGTIDKTHVRANIKGVAAREIQPSENAATPGATVLIWDLLVRLFHWLLVSTVTVAAITGFLAPEWWLDVHSWAGYTIAFLIAFRIAWGFIGSYYARFVSFLFPVSETVDHFRALAKKKSSHHRGHNPAGALMVFALLGVLIALTVSGLIILGGQENIGVLAGFVPFSIGSGIAVVHEILAFGLLGLIGAHILGVLAESVLSKENLVRAMFSGRKSAGSDFAVPDTTLAASAGSVLPRAIAASLVILLAGGVGAWSLKRVAPSGYITVPVNKTYASECGDCHQAYHPSLLPASSWKKMMAGLEDHFGEDASLGDSDTKDIAAYLSSYASEKWDSEAANNLRRVSNTDPLRITAAPYWRRRHEKISKDVFAQKAVGTKGNCIACHKDALSGHFDDENIDVPTPKSGKIFK